VIKTFEDKTVGKSEWTGSRINDRNWLQRAEDRVQFWALVATAM